MPRRAADLQILLPCIWCRCAALQRMLARLLGMGVRPERVRAALRA